MGSDKCYKDYAPGYYSNGDICSLCKPGYYSEKSSTECIKCPLGTFNSLTLQYFFKVNLTNKYNIFLYLNEVI